VPNPNRILCPVCKQPMAELRAGIRLTPIKSAIFDAIKAGGELGTTVNNIMDRVYGDGRRAPPGRHIIKSHVYQINELLLDVGLIIKGYHGNWRLLKIKDLSPAPGRGGVTQMKSMRPKTKRKKQL
jgi:hypothetical protein